MKEREKSLRAWVATACLFLLAATMIIPFTCDPRTATIRELSAIAEAYKFYCTVSFSAGEIGVIDTTINRGIKKSSSLGDADVLGVARSDISAQSWGTFVRSNAAQIACSEMVNAGEWIRQSTTEALGQGDVGVDSGAFAQATVDGWHIGGGIYKVDAMLTGAGAYSPVAAGSAAPKTAEYWTGAADATLTAEHDLSGITGLVKSTAGTPSQATAGTDYHAPGTDIENGQNSIDGDATHKGLHFDVNNDGTDDVHLCFDGTYYALLFGSVYDPTQNTARGIRYSSTGGIDWNGEGTWEDFGAGGGGNEYISFEIRLAALPQTGNNNDVVDFRQEWDSVAYRTHAERNGLTGASNDASSMWLGVQLPSDFDSFYSGTNIWIQVYSTDRANNTITMSVYDDTGDVDDGVNGADIEPGSDSTWTEASDQITETDANYAAGDWVWVLVEVNLDAGDSYLIGEGHIRYTKS